MSLLDAGIARVDLEKDAFAERLRREMFALTPSEPAVWNPAPQGK